MSLLKTAKQYAEESIAQPPPIKAVFYGIPSIGKTTLGLSAPNAVILDGNHGLKRVSGYHRGGAPVLPVDSFAVIRKFLSSEEVKPFDSVVIDEFGTLIQLSLQSHLDAGIPYIKAWGNVKNDISGMILNTSRVSGKHCFIIAHEKEIDKNNKVTKRIAGAGGSIAELMADADLIGYMYLDNGNRVLSFQSGQVDGAYAKGLGVYLPSPLIVPEVAPGQPNNFIETVILPAYYKKIRVDAEDQVRFESQYNQVLADVRALIDGSTTPETLTEAAGKIKALPHVGNSLYVARKLVSETASGRGWKWNGGKYEANE